ncbi:hypothetical protein BBJ28_00026931, partial [Nothophytophthora sp. Chile5]
HPDGVVVAHVVGNVQAVPIEEAVVSSSTIGCDGSCASAAEYCCAFEVTKRLNHVDRHTLTCHLHVPVAADAPAVGTWRFFAHELTKQEVQDGSSASSSSTASTSDGSNPAEDTAVPDQHVFQLLPVQWQQRQQEAEAAEAEAAKLQSRPPSLLYPLRPGKYEFRGFTTYDTPSITGAIARPRRGRPPRHRPAMTTVKDECLVTLRLLPDGTLRGTSREVVQPQVCRVHGRWQANRVAYVLEYRVREAVGHFRYSGAVVIEGDDDHDVNADKDTHKSTAKVKVGSPSCKRRETLSGKWENVDEGHAEGYEGGHGRFELELLQVDHVAIAIKPEKVEMLDSSSVGTDETKDSNGTAQHPSQLGNDAHNAIELDDDEDAIQALTTGDYELSGRATDSDGYEYAFDLKLELRAGGKLFGESRERVFQQNDKVFGLWTPKSITYHQKYIVKREEGMYTYGGELSCDGAVVRGDWVNAEEEFASARGEHGTFALLFTRSTRRWSTASHSHYPRSFRQGVLTTLMASARTHALPVALWPHIFAFCDDTWFVAS